VNWHRVFCHLSAEYGWTPDQISGMTLSQIHSYLTSAKDTKKMSYEEARETASGAKAQRDEWSASTMQQMIYG